MDTTKKVIFWPIPLHTISCHLQIQRETALLLRHFGHGSFNYIVVVIVIGIVCSKNKKQQRTSVRQELEMPEYYAEISSDSKEINTPKTLENYEANRESREYVDVDSSSQLPTIKMEKNVVYGVGIAQAFGEEGGEYEVVQPQLPSETPQSQLSHM